MASKKQPKALTPMQEIDEAYARINAALQLLAGGDDDNSDTVKARVAYGALQIMRQWARAGARRA